MKKIVNKICLYFILAFLFTSFMVSYHFNRVSVENEINVRVDERARELICVSHYTTDLKMVLLYKKLNNKLRTEGGSKISVEITDKLVHLYEGELDKRKYCMSVEKESSGITGISGVR